MRAEQAKVGDTDGNAAQNSAPIPFQPLLPREGFGQPQQNLQTYNFNYYPQRQADNGAQSFLGIGADLWVALFTFALVLATFVQAILILRAEGLTRRALRISQRQAVRAKMDAVKRAAETKTALDIANVNANAAIAAAAATQEVADQTETTMLSAELAVQRQLRAYVGITGGQVVISDDKTKIVAILKVENGGSSPAYKVRGRGAIKFEKTFDPAWDSEAKYFTQNAYILPSTEYRYEILADVEEIASKLSPSPKTPQRTIFVFGRIEYLDAFDESRWVNFRYAVGGHLEKNEGDIRPCEEGNEAN